jgi:hypothetical protein
VEIAGGGVSVETVAGATPETVLTLGSAAGVGVDGFLQAGMAARIKNTTKRMFRCVFVFIEPFPFTAVSRNQFPNVQLVSPLRWLSSDENSVIYS